MWCSSRVNIWTNFILNLRLSNNQSVTNVYAKQTAKSVTLSSGHFQFEKAELSVLFHVCSYTGVFLFSFFFFFFFFFQLWKQEICMVKGCGRSDFCNFSKLIFNFRVLCLV